MMRFGDVTLGKVRTSRELSSLLVDPCFESETVVIKPNWFSPHPANFTGAETLRMLLEALDSRVVVVEAYTLEKQDGSMKFTVNGEEVDWTWIMNHPSWDWAREGGRWDEIRRQDRWFMDSHGFSDLFQEFGVEYINVTEEVWSGRVADPGVVREVVEGVLGPVFREKLYTFLPEKLHELTGSTLVSFGKVKGIESTFPSLTMKNMFGLIPDPLRSWWHGPKDERLGDSIVDITKVYASFFRLYGICEAIKQVTISHPEGEVEAPWGRYNIIRDQGTLALGPNLVSLDAVLCGLIRVDPEKVSYLQKGEKVFGEYDRGQVERARKEAHNWFNL